MAAKYSYPYKKKNKNHRNKGILHNDRRVSSPGRCNISNVYGLIYKIVSQYMRQKLIELEEKMHKSESQLELKMCTLFSK